MNVHAVEVERAAARPLMSGFHALFSIGGFAGSLLMTAVLSVGIGAFAATLLAAFLMLIAIAIATPRLLAAAKVDEGRYSSAPKASCFSCRFSPP